MNVTLTLVSIMLMPLAIAGLALIHQGLGRSRSAAHAMLASLAAVAIASITFLVLGFSIAGRRGGPREAVFQRHGRQDASPTSPVRSRR